MNLITFWKPRGLQSLGLQPSTWSVSPQTTPNLPLARLFYGSGMLGVAKITSSFGETDRRLRKTEERLREPPEIV